MRYLCLQTLIEAKWSQVSENEEDHGEGLPIGLTLHISSDRSQRIGCDGRTELGERPSEEEAGVLFHNFGQDDLQLFEDGHVDGRVTHQHQREGKPGVEPFEAILLVNLLDSLGVPKEPLFLLSSADNVV